MEGYDRQPAPEPSLESAGTGTLLKQLFHDATDLLKKEAELARTEVREEVHSVTGRIGRMATAGVFALVGLGLLSTAVVLGLANYLEPWAAALVVGLAMFLIAAVLFGSAKAKGHHKPLEKTQRTLKEDMPWAKERTA